MRPYLVIHPRAHEMPNGGIIRKELIRQGLCGDTRDASANEIALPTELRWQGKPAGVD